jgi:hypothetical protein
MNVMGGITNETSNNTAEFIYSASGNYQDTIGGVNMSNQFNSAAAQGMGGGESVYVTSFP